ncbi:RIP metalloprotease RseP [Ramlibacter solisilvae]|uniref:Zinc metalloprotease n=1 Tax=Ramlibacter tataouinensis TaxID=94132 RepID=A0A127JNS7_9BURK|nr:RIP metalloprotease RseP [Ramlibacter tataouinensis]AMO21664.1 zinc metalloprotease [Ramlibacter tataouinensis]
MLTTILAFIVALGLLIAVHEYGHYRVAVACGVKVLRFSVGFGKTLYRYKPRKQRPGQDTEFVIGAFPLGGYVRMLDEREGDVPPEERHLAFNTQPLKSRAAIVAAGPLANLLLAVLLYAGVNWWGVQEPMAVLASPVPGSIAEQAGLRGGERVGAAGFDGDAMQPVRSFEDLRWLITRGALDGRDVRLQLEGGSRQPVLALSRLPVREADAQLFRRIGLIGPWTPPLIGELVDKGAAQRAGLRKGDLVLAVGGVDVADGMQLRERIRASVKNGQGARETWRVRREGQVLDLEVQPDAVPEGQAVVGRIGAYVGAPPETTVVRYGPVEGLWKGVVRTWEVSVMTLRMMGRMVIGQASIKNLSGPLTIADYAGKSASMGLTQYVVFLALISVSLGVLNLLPLPVLDGGHLMYYMYEAVTGRSISDAWMERLQRGGVAVLLLMMSIALFNDVSRLFG